MLTCRECGEQFERTGRTGPFPKWCSACKALRVRAQTIEKGRRNSAATTARYRARHPDRIRAYKALPHVRESARQYAADRYADNPEKQREINRRSYRNVPNAGRRHLLRGYGLTHEDYEQMHADQGGVCVICEKAETARDRMGRVRRLAVDHDHETGEVRGLLCHACNIALGYLDEDPERMESAAAYIRAAAARRLRVVR